MAKTFKDSAQNKDRGFRVSRSDAKKLRKTANKMTKAKRNFKTYDTYEE